MIISQITYPFLLVLAFPIFTHQQIRDPAFMATYNKYSDECEKEIGIDEAVVTKAWKENHFPNDAKLKCFFKCMNMKLGVLTAGGEVVDDMLRSVSAQFVDNSTDREIVTECGAIDGAADLCETSMKLMACIKAAILD